MACGCGKKSGTKNTSGSSTVRNASRSSGPIKPMKSATINSNLGFVPIDFDWEFYINYYIDLKNARIVTKQAAELHYKKFGKKENRVYNRKFIVEANFDWKKYLSLNPDLQNQGITNQDKAIKHWVEIGKLQNRKYIL